MKRREIGLFTNQTRHFIKAMLTVLLRVITTGNQKMSSSREDQMTVRVGGNGSYTLLDFFLKSQC